MTDPDKAQAIDWIWRFIFVLALTTMFAMAVDARTLQSGIYFYIFQDRDLERARRLLDGELIFFGPEMTGGGHLPGPLYYCLLAIPLAIRRTWESAWYFLVGLSLAGAAAFWFHWRAKFSPVAALLFFALFSLALPTQRYLTLFLNVSYMLPFATLTLLLYTRAFTARSAASRRRAFYGACVLTGLGLQLHFSMICFLFALLLAQSLAQWGGWPRFTPKTFLCGLGIFAAPSLPYLAWLSARALGFEFGQDAPYAGRSALAPLSLLQMANYFSGLRWPHIMLNPLQRVAETVPAPLFAVVAAKLWSRARLSPDGEDGRLVRLLALTAAVGFVPFTYWFSATIGVRYIMPFYVSSAALTAAAWVALAHDAKFAKAYMTAAAALTVALCLWIFVSATELTLPYVLERLGFLVLAAIVLYLSDGAAFSEFWRRSAAALVTIACATSQLTVAEKIGLNPSPLIMPKLVQWRWLWKDVYSATGWDYDRAIHSIFFLNHHIEQDPQPGYRSLMSGRKAPVVESQDPPDGFFAALARSSENATPAEIKSFILAQNIPEEIKTGLREGHIELGKFVPRKFTIVPYRVRRPDLLPKSFHNFGQGYNPTPDDLKLRAVTGREGVVEAQSEIIFKWNECPDAHPFCDTGALVRLKMEPAGATVQVRVVGQAISQVSPWISPAWTQAWIEPYLELKCRGNKERRFVLASSIGYNREYATDPNFLWLYGNNSWVAPFERDFNLDCIPVELTLGRKASAVESIQALRSLPGRALTFSLRRPAED